MPREAIEEGPVERTVAASSTARADRALTRWQTRLLPLMGSMVVALTLFFFLATCAQLVYLHRRIGQAPRIAVSELLPAPSTTATHAEAMELMRVRSMIALEANTLERRYHQASVVLMSQVWVRYLGFATGMILALIGAAFILGRMQERLSELSANVGGAGAALRSSSPGLMLVLSGTILMLATVITRQEGSVTDLPVYAVGWSSSPGLGPESTPSQLPPRRKE